MSFGISVTDILKLFEGCVWLLARFDKNNSADEQLKYFISDVQLLEKRLWRLAQALEDALERCLHPEIDARELKCDLQDLVGDAGHTIDEAKDLARNHIRIQRNAAGFIHNVVWAAHAEPKAENLRKAMQFHAQKIFLVIEPVNLKLLTTIDGKVDEMLAKLDQLLERSGVIPYTLPALPGWLDTRFREALFTDQPIPFEQPSNIPLREGFDALYLHYRESTYAFRDQETAEQTAEQYLNLLKCQWLVNVLRSGDHFVRAGPLYPRLLKQIEQRIIKEHQRTDIIRFQDDELIRLSPTAFMIWPPQQVVEVRNATDPNHDEHILLRLTLTTPLVGEKDSVVVFRTGPATLRIARRSSDRAGTPYYENEHYNIHQDAFVPYYAIAEHPPAPRRHSAAPLSQPLPFNISIYRGNATGAIDYRLGSDADVYNFQRAVTGYQVVFDKSVTWGMKQSGIRGQLSRGKGRMQIWHWKPLEELATASEQVTSPTMSTRSPRSHDSTTSDAVVERLVQRRDTSVYTVDARNTSGPVISAITPTHPVIVIYGKSNEMYTYYHIELDFDIQINPSACPCDSESKKAPQNRQCARSVIEKRNRKDSRLPFRTRTLTATKTNLSAWNLGVFAQPRHPLFYSKKTVQSLNTDFLNVDFTSVPDRMEFAKKFDKALQLRNKAEAEYRRIVEATRFLGERNGHEPLPPPQRGPPRIPDRPPEIRPLSPISVFEVEDSGAQSS
ncbi:hypothetical protein CC80DRAFT_246106 [Byssothecium circinans]|uniref:Fungal N-terminal domain-containing protein n=1 Tax=Byssothecium circinans TaxID=147558 RepID=A0A6A5TCX6_9PLEO|nr:hypothetical protein CC80DRAFT_246106 [Byssothecium circinans]